MSVEPTRRAILMGTAAVAVSFATGGHATELQWDTFSIAHLHGPVSYDDVLASVREQVRVIRGPNQDHVSKEVAGMMWDHKCIEVIRSRQPMPGFGIQEI